MGEGFPFVITEKKWGHWEYSSSQGIAINFSLSVFSIATWEIPIILNILSVRNVDKNVHFIFEWHTGFSDCPLCQGSIIAFGDTDPTAPLSLGQPLSSAGCQVASTWECRVQHRPIIYPTIMAFYFCSQ